MQPTAPDLYERLLLEGMPTSDVESQQLRALLHDAGKGDGDFAEVLLALLAERHSRAARFGIDGGRDSDHGFVEDAAEASNAKAPGSSSLRGSVGPGRETWEQWRVADLVDVRTLSALARAGTLGQRRLAMTRLGVCLAEHKTQLPPEMFRLGQKTLSEVLDVEVAYERFHARRRAGHAPRELRAEDERWQRLLASVQARLDPFWEDETAPEPVTDLRSEDRAHLLVRVRDMSDAMVAYLAAIVEGSDGHSPSNRRLTLISSLRHAGDARLVSALVVQLHGGDRELTMEAAKALSSIDDPRVTEALAEAFERSVVDWEKVVLAGALARAGDGRGARYVRKLIKTDDERLLRRVLEAMQTTGRAEIGRRVVTLLEHRNSGVARQAVRTLGRIGDQRVLPALLRLRDQARASAQRGPSGRSQPPGQRAAAAASPAEIDDSLAAIRARVELQGGDVEALEALERSISNDQVAQAALPQDPLTVRVRSQWEFLTAHVLLLGGVRAAVGRLERAAARRRGWAAPLVTAAAALARRAMDVEALVYFRRALEVDRSYTEAQPQAMRLLVQSTLRRAETVEQQSRHAIARGLLEEVLALDLRKVPGQLRYEVERRLAIIVGQA